MYLNFNRYLSIKSSIAPERMEIDLSKWYRKELHFMVKKYFKNYFPDDMIRVSKKEAYPNIK